MKGKTKTYCYESLAYSIDTTFLSSFFSFLISSFLHYFFAKYDAYGFDFCLIPYPSFNF